MVSEKSSGQTSHTFQAEVTKSVSLDYLLFLPGEYASQTDPWPLIFFLHGAGERGNDVQMVKKHGPPQIVETQDDFPFVVISPQCPEDQWWKSGALIALLDDVVANHNIDEDRIYLTGLSMGGFGTWMAATENPDRFAAIAPICGGGLRIGMRRTTHLPTWVFHGAKDTVVPIDESQRLVDRLKSLDGNVKFTIYPDAKHNSWTDTYNNPELYDWFLSHRRRAR